MPASNQPIPSQTNIAVQNNTTGAIDYLQFTGTTLTSSSMFQYTSADFNIVADGHFGVGAGAAIDLVAQNAAGAVDILGLDSHGNLIASEMLSSSLPHIVGAGNFGLTAAGQVGTTLVSQLPNGQLDMLGINGAGQLIHSDLIANTVGLAPVVGVADAQAANPNNAAFNGVGSNTENVIVQSPNGSMDTLGFSGNFNDNTLNFSSSLLLPGSAGSPAVQSINPNNDVGSIDENIGTGANSTEGVQMIGQLANGTFDALYADSGYGGSTHEGNIYASELLNLSLPGWHAINAGFVTGQLFPYS
jgi:hypothetical protein